MSEEKLEIKESIGTWELKKSNDRRNDCKYKLEKRLHGEPEMTIHFDKITNLKSWGWVVFEIDDNLICWYPNKEIPDKIINYFDSNTDKDEKRKDTNKNNYQGKEVSE